MNEQTKNYLLIGVAALTVVNSIFIFTMDKGGRVIDCRIHVATDTAASARFHYS
jgi:hypothetical protein